MNKLTSKLPDSRPRSGGVLLHTLTATLGLLLLCVLVYVPAFNAGLLWDDAPLIFNNPLIHSEDGLKSFWLTSEAPDYFPLTWSALWVQWRLFADNPVGYHAVNLAMHALFVVLIWRVLVRLRIPGAWVAAAVFAIHPATASTVMWISEQKNTLSGLLLAGSVLMYLKAEDTDRRRFYFGSLTLFCLALLAKSAVVMTPLALLILAWWRRGRVTWSDLRRTAPMFIMSLVLGLVTVYFQQVNAMGEGPTESADLPARIAGVGWNLWFYWSKAVVPWRVTMVYPKWEIDPAVVLAWVPLAGVAALAVSGWALRRGPGRPVLAGLGLHAVMVLPVLGLVGMAYHRYAYVADHLQYVALIGPIALLVASGSIVLRRIRANALVLCLVSTALLSGLGWMTHQKALAYREAESMWRDTLVHNPDAWVAYNNLGMILDARGERHEAITLYRQSLEIRPDYYLARNNLGIALAGQGQPELAARQFRKAIEVWPDYERGHNNLGLALAQLKLYEQAAESLQRAVDISPQFAEAHVNLADMLKRLGRSAEAVEHLRRAVDIKPRLPEAQFRLGSALLEDGEMVEATEHLLLAVELRPQWVDALNSAAWALASDPAVRDPGRAVELAKRAVELSQNRHPAVLDTLAAAYHSAGRLNEAIKTAETAAGLARKVGDTALADDIDSRLERYRRETSETLR